MPSINVTFMFTDKESSVVGSSKVKYDEIVQRFEKLHNNNNNHLTTGRIIVSSLLRRNIRRRSKYCCTSNSVSMRLVKIFTSRSLVVLTSLYLLLCCNEIEGFITSPKRKTNSAFLGPSYDVPTEPLINSKYPIPFLYQASSTNVPPEPTGIFSSDNNMEVNPLFANPFSSFNSNTTKVSRKRRKMTTTEMVATTTAGTALTLVVLFTLALNSEDTVFLMQQGTSLETALEAASYNIADAALPMTASDVVSVAIGESIAGVVGTIISFSVSSAATMPMTNSKKNDEQQQESNENNILLPNVAGRNSKSQRKTKNTSSPVKVSQAIADSDFLLTNAATYPLLEAIGLPPFVASLASTALAIVPYGIVKIGAQRREQLIEEDRILQQLLKNQQQQEESIKAKDSIQGFFTTTFGWVGMKSNNNVIVRPVETIDPNTLQPIRDDSVRIDPVEVFSDVSKWLQLSVLQADFGGTLTWQNEILPPAVDSALFGSIAALSSQIYSDVLYAYFGFGGDDKKNMVLSRTLFDWAMLYSTKLLYYATLFAVYEIVQGPATDAVTALLSGGADACFGSQNYNYCLETYMNSNPPGASPEGQIRSFITAIVSFWNNSQLSNWFT